MYPRLFSIGPFTVYSYGLMLGIGFIVASYLLTKEFKRKGLDQNFAATITFLAMIFGIVGSKILYLIENWKYFIRSPFEMTFSPGGLTWYGGFVLATLAILIYSRKKKITFLKVCDAAAPSLILAYGIARIGCHLAGDGDYGMPTNLPWAAIYSNGTYPPSIAFQDFPEIVNKYGINGVVPDTIPVHPAPLYEFIIGLILFFILWKLRTRLSTNGILFMVYLIFSGSARFAIEFIRINPRILWGFSEAQIISIIMMLLGFIGIGIIKKQLSAKPVQSNI
jgi:phosphatidylglycerol:prolipoprotein diacylglycerol transferase